MKEIPAKISIVLHGSTYEAENVNMDMFIDENSINEEFIRQPATFAWYAVMSAEAESVRDTLKNELEILYADLDRQVRSEIELRGDKVTEKLVDQEILRKSEYREKKEELLEAGRQVGVMRALKEALVHKKDMLISLGANMRNESSPNLRIMEGNEEEEVKPSTSKTISKPRVKSAKERLKKSKTLKSTSSK